MNIKAICDNVDYISCYPGLKAMDLRDSSIEDGGSWSQAFGARVLCLAQIIASIVAIPLVLLGSILGASLAFCFGEKGATWEVLKSGGQLGIFHLSLIPAVLIAALTPHSWKWFSPADEVGRCFYSPPT